MCHPLFRGTNKLHSKLIPRYPLFSSAIQIFGQNQLPKSTSGKGKFNFIAGRHTILCESRSDRFAVRWIPLITHFA